MRQGGNNQESNGNQKEETFGILMITLTAINIVGILVFSIVWNGVLIYKFYKMQRPLEDPPAESYSLKSGNSQRNKEELSRRLSTPFGTDEPLTNKGQATTRVGTAPVNFRRARSTFNFAPLTSNEGLVLISNI